MLETTAALERLAELAALERAPRSRRMLVIVNPYATTMSDRIKSLVVYALQGRYDVHAVDTKAKGHAIELCREAAHEGYDVVVAFGGDGTVNEAANGLAGSPTPLTCLPGGATNVYCRMLGDSAAITVPGDRIDALANTIANPSEMRNKDLLAEGKKELIDAIDITQGSTTFKLRRITDSKRMRAKLLAFKGEMARRMHQPIPEQGRWLSCV